MATVLATNLGSCGVEKHAADAKEAALIADRIYQAFAEELKKFVDPGFILLRADEKEGAPCWKPSSARWGLAELTELGIM